MSKHTLLDSYICWNPGTDQVALSPWPGRPDGAYKYTWGACDTYMRALSFEDRKKMAFIYAMHLIVRDKCDPLAVHQALLDLKEYIDGCDDGMPGVHARRQEAGK